MGILDLHVKTPLHNEGGLLMAELFSELDQIDNLEDFKVYRLSLIHISEPTRLGIPSRMPSSA